MELLERSRNSIAAALRTRLVEEAKMKTTTIRFLSIIVILLCAVAGAIAEPPEFAIVVSGDLRVRSHYSLDAAVMGHLDDGDIVAVLDVSKEQMRIGTMLDYWYKVRKGSLTGWTYGYFLSTKSKHFPQNSITLYHGRSMDDSTATHYYAFTDMIDRDFTIYDDIVGFSEFGRHYFNYSRVNGYGYLVVSETLTGEMIWEGEFYGDDPVWEMNALYISVPEGIDENENIITQRVSIENGSIYYAENQESMHDEGGGQRAMEEEAYWDRWTVYEPDSPRIHPFHPRAYINDDHELALIFMAFIEAEKWGEYKIAIYEQREDGELYSIDEFAPVFSSWANPSGNFSEDKGRLTTEIIWSYVDNALPVSGFLYYYTGSRLYGSDLSFKRYRLRSASAPEIITEGIFAGATDRYILELQSWVARSPDNGMTAFSDSYDIYIHRGHESFADLKNRAYSGYDIDADSGEIRMKEYLQLDADMPFITIGSMSWSADGRFLFFDNSGICLGSA